MEQLDSESHMTVGRLGRTKSIIWSRFTSEITDCSLTFKIIFERSDFNSVSISKRLYEGTT